MYVYIYIYILHYTCVMYIKLYLFALYTESLRYIKPFCNSSHMRKNKDTDMSFGLWTNRIIVYQKKSLRKNKQSLLLWRGGVCSEFFYIAQCFLPINNNSISSKAHIHIFISECVRGAYIELVQFFQGSQKRSLHMYSS